MAFLAIDGAGVADPGYPEYEDAKYITPERRKALEGLVKGNSIDCLSVLS
jgi:hypothetical protein